MQSILIVEDEKRVADLLKTGLEENGYRVTVAYDGAMGLRLFRAQPFQLVVSDVVLPRMDGFELCREIRRIHAGVPILMLTALGTTDDKLDGFDAGADDYLVKPGVKALVYDNSYIQRQYALAGLDRKNGEVIVKVINAEDVPMPVKFDFRNAEFEPLGKRICLWADSKFDENTFEERNRIVPVEEVFNHVSPQMEVTFRPQSMTVLRLKLKNTHRQ